MRVKKEFELMRRYCIEKIGFTEEEIQALLHDELKWIIVQFDELWGLS